MGDIEKRIRDITSKPSFSTCEISYEVLKKMKNIVNKNNPTYDEQMYEARPLFKGGTKEKDDPESYRPVNIFPSPGRIMDMCTSEQQTKFAEQIGVIPRSVHGFRKKLTSIGSYKCWLQREKIAMGKKLHNRKNNCMMINEVQMHDKN